MRPSLNVIRKEIYARTSSEIGLAGWNVDPNDFKKNPYTFLKSRYYIEIGSIITFLLIPYKITANNLTFIYAYISPIAAILISINAKIPILIGAAIFFNRSILDWIDGYWASYKRQTSYKGNLLDSFGAKIGTISFNTGLGIFCYNLNNNLLYLYLTIGLLFLHSTLIREYSSNLILRDVANNMVGVKKESNKDPNRSNFHHSKKYLNFIPNIILSFFYNAFDGRARSIDFILLIMIVDLFSNTQFTPFLFIFIVLKSVMHYLGDLYIFLQGKWLEIFEEV